MSEVLTTHQRPLSAIVTPVDEKITARKEPEKPYIGLENIPSGGAYLLSWLPASSSVSTNSMFQAGDVLFGKLRPNLRKCLSAPFDGYCSTDILVLRANDGIEPSFAGKVMKSELVGAAAERTSVGTKMPRTSWKELAELEVFCPDYREQCRLAKVLGTLDSAIRETETIIAKLKTIKQGLLHDLLTRGIDANGELRPSRAEAPHLYKESPLGWIPREWNVRQAGALCSLVTKGTTPALQRMWLGTDGIRFLRVDNLTFDGQLDFATSRFRIAQATHRGELARSVLLPGDVLTNIVGPPLGKLGLISDEVGEANINQAIALFRPKCCLLSRFLLLHLASSRSQTWLHKRAKQTSGQLNLTLALCQELPIPELSICEQRLVVERLGEAQQHITLEEAGLAKLRQLTAGLLDDLLTGRVRVTPLLASDQADTERNTAWAGSSKT